jgi:hypothetical protein
VANLLAADFPAVGTMHANETSAGAMVEVQRRSPSDAAGEQSQRRDKAVLRWLMRCTTLGSSHV